MCRWTLPLVGKAQEEIAAPALDLHFHTSPYLWGNTSRTTQPTEEEVHQHRYCCAIISPLFVWVFFLWRPIVFSRKRLPNWWECKSALLLRPKILLFSASDKNKVVLVVVVGSSISMHHPSCCCSSRKDPPHYLSLLCCPHIFFVVWLVLSCVPSPVSSSSPKRIMHSSDTKEMLTPKYTPLQSNNHAFFRSFTSLVCLSACLLPSLSITGTYCDGFGYVNSTLTIPFPSKQNTDHLTTRHAIHLSF